MSNNERMRVYMKDRYHRRRLEVVSRLGGRCVQCGSKERLHLDHIDPKQKSVSWGSLAGMSQEKVEKEIVKSQLLCQECHTAKTIEERGFKPGKGVHGTVVNYNYGCRCDECRKAKSIYNKKYNRRAVVV